eukprot:5670654-Prymnesium_polylepis.1
MAGERYATSTTVPKAPSLVNQVVNHVVVVVGHVTETWRTCSVRALRVGRCRTPARSRCGRPPPLAAASSTSHRRSAAVPCSS